MQSLLGFPDISHRISQFWRQAFCQFWNLKKHDLSISKLFQDFYPGTLAHLMRQVTTGRPKQSSSCMEFSPASHRDIHADGEPFSLP